MGSRQSRPDTAGLHSIPQGATKPTLALRASVPSFSKRGCTRLRTSSEVALFTPQLRSRNRRVRCDRQMQHKVAKATDWRLCLPSSSHPPSHIALTKPTTGWSCPNNVSEYEKAAWPPSDEIPRPWITAFPRMRCLLVTIVKVHVTGVSAVRLYFFHEVLALYQGK